jgi:HAMP domain-containing protein
VFKLLNDFILSFAVFFVIAFIAILAFARKLSISLTKPLIYLTQAADKLSKGEMDTEISVKSNDEIQSLAEAFERLRESVKLLMRL